MKKIAMFVWAAALGLALVLAARSRDHKSSKLLQRRPSPFPVAWTDFGQHSPTPSFPWVNANPTGEYVQC